jgi:glutathione S-transferase
MSDELVFYTNPMSRGRMIRWMLEEVGEPYRTELMDFGPSMHEANYLAINPMGKVPAITHRGQIVTECAGIILYLADAFPQAGLAPPPAERGAYYRWISFMAGPFEAALTDKSLGVEVPKDKQGMCGYGNLDRAIDAVEGALDGRDHIAGDRFTAADLFVASHLGFQMAFGNLEKRPTFARYVQLHQSRPAFARVAEIDQPMPMPG